MAFNKSRKTGTKPGTHPNRGYTTQDLEGSGALRAIIQVAVQVGEGYSGWVQDFTHYR